MHVAQAVVIASISANVFGGGPFEARRSRSYNLRAAGCAKDL